MRTFTLGAGSGVDVVTYSTAGETAKITSATEKAGIAKAVKNVASGADTIYNVKVGDKINISKVFGTGDTLLNGGKAYAATGTVEVSSAVDAFLLKNGADYFLVYEASGSPGDSSSLGSSAEVIKLVGLTDTSKITLEGGIVTIA